MSSFSCAVCSRSFVRREHLTRHMATHTAGKPFECPLCHRNFARRDVLRRHQVSQHPKPSSEDHDTNEPLASVDRACLECAAARVRCTKRQPCKRCSERGINCIFPASRDSSSSASRSTTRADSSDDGNLFQQRQHLGIALSNTLEFTADASLIETPMPWGTGMGEMSSPMSLSAPEPMEWDSTLSFGGLPINWMCDWDIPPQQQQQIQHQQQQPQQQMPPNGSISAVNPMMPILTDTTALFPHMPPMSMSAHHALNPAAPAATTAVTSDAPRPMSTSTYTPTNGTSTTETSTTGTIRSIPASVSVSAPARNHVIGPSNDNNSTESTHSTKSNTSSTSTIARSYVDGDYARAPFAGLALPIRARSRQMALVSDMDLSRRVSAKLIEAYRPGPGYENDESSSDSYVSPESYATFQAYTKTNSTSTTPPSSFPTRDQLATLCRRYFAIFHPVYPFLRHREFLRESNEQPLLLLAVAALGTRFSLPTMRREFGEVLGAALRDKVRDELPQAVISTCREPQEKTRLLTVLRAAMIDCLLGMGADRDASQARLQRYLMFEAYYKVKDCLVASVHDVKQMARNPNVDAVSLLSRWTLYQGQIRAVMMTWMIDCMLQYQCDCRRNMELTDADIPMPCASQVWENPTKATVCSEFTGNTQTVLQAVETLYIEKRLPTGLTEFGVCILIHAIFRRTTEVLDRSSTTLSEWSPRSSQAMRQSHTGTEETRTGQQQQQQQNMAMSQRLIPSSRASMWRNSACDCLDVLHWSANTKVARAAGWEHPNILLLHLSRLLLLTPAAYLRSLPYKLSTKDETTVISNGVKNASININTTIEGTVIVELEQKLTQWAVYDQYKARLAVIHAGAVLWHARRYRCGLWTEPFAVYLATLVLWGYSKIASQLPREAAATARSDNNKENASRRSSSKLADDDVDDDDGMSEQEEEEDYENDSEEDEDSDSDEGLVFYVDRPCDDEIVQQFVRRGHAMSAHVTRVGDILDPASPAKILKEGMVVLGASDDRDDQDVWGSEMGFYRGLQRVLVLLEEQQQQQTKPAKVTRKR